MMNNNGKTMRLRIEDGILLKPCAAPFNTRTGKHNVLNGWTPDRTPAMHARFNELRAETGPGTPPFIVWQQVEIEEGKGLVERRLPWPGWVPLPSPLSGRATDEDKTISRAYFDLFKLMNPEARVKVDGVWSGPSAVTPPDGDYILDGGEMRPSETLRGETNQEME